MPRTERFRTNLGNRASPERGTPDQASRRSHASQGQGHGTRPHRAHGLWREFGPGLKALGLVSEIIAWRLRLFVPLGEGCARFSAGSSSTLRPAPIELAFPLSMGVTVVESIAADLAQRLAACAEAVCHHYLPNGVRHGELLDCGRRVRRQRPKLYVVFDPHPARQRGHWTDAASGEHGDLLDLIRLNRGLATVSEAFDEARAFLNEPPRQAWQPAAHDTAAAPHATRPKPQRASSRSQALFQAPSPKPICGAAASPAISIIQPSASWPTAITAPRAASSPSLCLRSLPA